MITLDKDSRQTKFFLWCLKNPMAKGSYEKEDGSWDYREPGWYLENGTTICHLFWACLWAPLIITAIISLALMAIVQGHVEAYEKYGTPGLFIPSGVLLGVILAMAIVVLCILGAGKIGLLAYLKALKEKVCIRISFVEKINPTNTQS